MDQLLLLIITSLLKGRVEKEIEDIYKSTIQQQQKNIFASYCTNPKETFPNNHALLVPTHSRYIPQMLAAYLANLINQSQ